MENYIIGSIIKEYRIRLEISQEDLAFGLCAVSTLSRIENGSQIPGRKLTEALFSKMGMNPPASAIPMNRSDFKRENLEYEIIDKTADGSFNIFEQLEAYKNCSASMDIFEQQFYSFFKSMAEDALNHNCEKSLQEFEAELKLTLPDYRNGEIPKVKLLTKTEIFILSNIARNLYFSGKKESATELMEFLYAYFEKGIVSEEEKAKTFPVILLNLENWYGLRGDYQKALELSEKGIDICIHYGKLTQFPYQLFNKGWTLLKLNNLDEGQKFIKHAFSIFEAMNETRELQYGKKCVLEEFNLNF